MYECCARRDEEHSGDMYGGRRMSRTGGVGLDETMIF